jgi:hypothetical protein
MDTRIETHLPQGGSYMVMTFSHPTGSPKTEARANQTGYVDGDGNESQGMERQAVGTMGYTTIAS